MLQSYNLLACASVQKLAHGPFIFIVQLLCRREPESMVFSPKAFLTFKHSFSLQNQKVNFRLSRCPLKKIMVWEQHKVEEEAMPGNGAACGTWSSTCFQLQATHLALPPCRNPEEDGTANPVPGREAQPCCTIPQPDSCLWGLFQLSESSMMRSKCDQISDLYSHDLLREGEVKLPLSNLCKLTTNGVILPLSQHWKKYLSLLFLAIKLIPLCFLFIKSAYKFALHKKGSNDKTSYRLWSSTFESKIDSSEKTLSFYSEILPIIYTNEIPEWYKLCPQWYWYSDNKVNEITHVWMMAEDTPARLLHLSNTFQRIKRV